MLNNAQPNKKKIPAPYYKMLQKQIIVIRCRYYQLLSGRFVVNTITNIFFNAANLGINFENGS